jgi:hypothetical protein
MAKPKTLPRELRPKERVVAAVDMPGIPSGTGGKVTFAEGFAWIRYWVRFDNGVVRGSINRDKLARPAEWTDIQARLARGETIGPAAADDGAGAAGGADGDGDGGEEPGGDTAVVNGVTVPALLIERTKRRLEALGVSR